MKTFICILFLLLSGKTYSQNIYYVNVQQSDNTGNGLSWATAFKDLQHAIHQAAAGDEVWVAKGTYLPTEYLPGATGSNPRDKSFFLNKNIKIYGGFNGNEAAISERNIDQYPSILSADFSQDDNLHGELDSLVFDGYAENAYHVMVTSKLPVTAQINGFTIMHGNATGDTKILNGTDTYYRGIAGGLLNYESKPLIRNVTFIENRAVEDAGAVYNKSCSGIVFDSCHFEYNLAYSRIIQSDIQGTSNESLQIDFYDSHTCNAGGIYNSVGTITINNSSFLNNHAVSIIKYTGIASVVLGANGLEEESKSSGEATASANGGALYASTSNITITNTIFESNSAKSEIRLYSKATLETSSGFSPDGEAITYVKGTATTNGGACAFDNLGNTSISNSVFRENSANALTNAYSISINNTYTGSQYYPDADGLVNTSAIGGAIQAYANAKFSMNKCFFYQNKALSSVYHFSHANNSGSETPSVDADAQASSFAGAVHLNNAGADTAKIGYCVFAENLARANSQAFVPLISGSYAKTASRSTAGALHVQGHFIISNNTIAKNQVLAETFRQGTTGNATLIEEAAAIYLSAKTMSSTSKGVNNILWGNTGAFNLSIYPFAKKIEMYNSIIEGSGGSSSWLPSYGIDSGGNLDIDPIFVDTNSVLGVDNIASTADDGLRLAASSPGIDSGADNDSFLTDILENAISNSTDIGAYEYACSVTDSLSINSPIALPGGTFQASAQLNGLSQLEADTRVTFEAGKVINLNPGFETKTNVVFSANIINPCLNLN